MSTCASVDLDYLLLSVYECSERLAKDIQRLHYVRQYTLAQLYGIIEELDKHHFNVNISKLVGSSVGIAGGVLSVLGIALSPVSLGTSLVLTAIGGGAAAVGGFVTTGTGIAEHFISKKKKSKAQAAIDADRAQVEVVKKRWKMFEWLSDTIMKAIEEGRVCTKQSAASNNVVKKLKAAWSVFNERLDSKYVESAIFLCRIISLGKNALRIASSVWDVLQVLFLGLEKFASQPGWVASLATKIVGRTAYRVFDGLFLGIGLVIDLATFISTVYDMCHGSRSKVASKLREIAEKLEEEQIIWMLVFQSSKLLESETAKKVEEEQIMPMQAFLPSG